VIHQVTGDGPNPLFGFEDVAGRAVLLFDGENFLLAAVPE